MATIRATCDTCGDVELTVAAVTVRLCVDDDTATYRFRCPSCRLTQVKGADERTADLLAAAGVRVERWRLPLELAERPVGRPITHDDLLDFHDLLASGDGWLSELIGH